MNKTILSGLLVFVVCAASAWYFLATRSSTSNTEAATSSLAASGEYAQGVHYQTLEKPLTVSAASTGKISVLEFFWYGCVHCQAFEPRLVDWLANTSDDVVVEQLPVTWNEFTRLHAALFYVAQGAPNTAQLHEALFDRVMELRQERNLASQTEQLAEFFEGYGFEKNELADLLASSEVQASVSNAEQMMKQAAISSTPSVVVDGRWVVLNNEAVGTAGIFNVIDYLVQKARDAR